MAPGDKMMNALSKITYATIMRLVNRQLLNEGVAGWVGFGADEISLSNPVDPRQPFGVWSGQNQAPKKRREEEIPGKII